MNTKPGCRGCGEIYTHKETCPLPRSIQRTVILDSERAQPEGEQLCARCDKPIYLSLDVWVHRDTGSYVCAGLWATPKVPSQPEVQEPTSGALLAAREIMDKSGIAKFLGNQSRELVLRAEKEMVAIIQRYCQGDTEPARWLQLPDVPRKGDFYLAGWYFQRRLSNNALQVVEVNYHGVVWRIGATDTKYVTEIRATGDYEWLGPIAPSNLIATPKGEKKDA